MHLDYFLLPFEGFEIMGDCNQVLFGSQLIGWMSPITVSEDSQLSASHKLIEPFFQRCEIAGGAFGPRRKFLRKQRSLGGIGFESGNDIHPVERMQLIKMDNMVVHIQYGGHDVAYHLSIRRDDDIERVLYRSYRAKRMDGGTYSTYASYENPSVTRVTVFHDCFDSTHHCTGTIGVFNFSVLNVGLDPEMAFYAGKRVYDYSF